jgi:hypothetical protein
MDGSGYAIAGGLKGKDGAEVGNRGYILKIQVLIRLLAQKKG